MLDVIAIMHLGVASKHAGRGIQVGVGVAEFDACELWLVNLRVERIFLNKISSVCIL